MRVGEEEGESGQGGSKGKRGRRELGLGFKDYGPGRRNGLAGK